jgi:hypothetical protein
MEIKTFWQPVVPIWDPEYAAAKLENTRITRRLLRIRKRLQTELTEVIAEGSKNRSAFRASLHSILNNRPLSKIIINDPAKSAKYAPILILARRKLQLEAMLKRLTYEKIAERSGVTVWCVETLRQKNCK